MNKKAWIRTCGIVGGSLLLAGLGYYCYVPDLPLARVKKKYGRKPSDFLPVKGMEVHYREEGIASDEPPLVLLHGTTSSLFTWNGWVDRLKEQHRIIRLDLPGFGLTGPHPDKDYRLEAYLEFLQAFLAALGVKQCILAGNSLGGEIAWRYTLQHPGQVAKLVLIGAAGYPVDIKQLPLKKLPISFVALRIPLLRQLSVKFTTPATIRKSLEYLYGNKGKVGEELVQRYYDLSLREGNREALAERMKSLPRPSPWQQIPSIQVPALILWGAKDRLIPLENAQRFHQHLPDSRLVIFPEAGHMPMEEVPIESAAAVVLFLKE